MALGLTYRGEDVFAPNDVNGSPRSVKNQEGQVWATEIERSIEGASVNLKSAKTWAELAASPGSVALQKGEVTDDPGTHTDPVVGGTVQNQGTYSWSTSPAGWKRTGNYSDASNKLDNSTASGTVMGRKAAGTGAIESLNPPDAKEVLELQNVDNTSDADKPISAVQQAEFDDQALKRSMVEQRVTPGLLDDEASWSVVDQTSGQQLMTLDFEGRAHLIRSNEGPLLDETYSHVIGSPAGNVGLGFRHDGGLEVAGQTHNGLAHADYKSVRTDYAGRVIEAIDHDDVNVIVTRHAVWVEGGDAYLWARSTGRISKLTDMGTVRFASVSGGLLRIILTDGKTIETAMLGSADTIAATVDRILHLPSSGQSNSVGSASLTVLTTAPPRPGRALMYGIGPRVLGNDQNSPYFRPIPAYFLNDIVDAQEIKYGSAGETHMSSMLYQLTGARPNTDAALGALYGIGSTAYADLKKGTAAWDNLVLGCWRARLKAAMLGLAFLIPAMPWDQGEANSGAAPGVYLGYLQELQGDITELVGDMNGLPAGGQVPLVYSQLTTFPHYSVSPNVALDQLAAHIADPAKFACIGPKYQYTYAADNVHLSAQSQHLQGAMMGRAVGQIMGGGTPRPLYGLTAVRTGAQVLLTFNVPSGALTLDAVTVTDPGNYGFVWSDNGDGNSVSIVSVSIASATTLLITLSAVPTGTNQAIRIALDAAPGANPGPASGARSCLRDTSPDTDRLGQHMYNWACHQRIAVTV